MIQKNVKLSLSMAVMSVLDAGYDDQPEYVADFCEVAIARADTLLEPARDGNTDPTVLPSMAGISAVQLTQFSYFTHALAHRSGWWKDPATGEPMSRDSLSAICKMHSELSEACEAQCTDSADDKLPHRLGVEVELADAVLRIFDFAAASGLDIGAAMVEKLRYNQKRADHKLSNRNKSNGKRA